MRHCHFLTYFTLLISISIVVACTSKQTSSKLDCIASLIQEHPDSALTTIRTFDTSALNTRSLRAYYSLLYAMALDKNWIDTTDEAVIAPAVGYYNKHHDPERRAKAWYYLGRIQYNGHRYDEAILSLIQAAQWSIHLDDRFRSLVFQAMGDTYGATSLYEEALSFSDSSIVYCLKAGDMPLANASLYRKAQNLNNLKRFHESDSIFHLLLSDTLVKKDTRLYPRILSGYAMTVLGLYDDATKARDLFEQCLSKGRFDSYNHWGAYAYCLAATGNRQKSEQIFEQLRAMGLEDTFAYLGWKGRTETKHGNASDAYALTAKAMDLQTENVRKTLRQSVIKTQLEHAQAKNVLLQEKVNSRRVIVLLLLLIFVGLATATWWWIRQRIRQTDEEKDALLETISILTKRQPDEDITDRYIEIYRTYLQQMGVIRDMLRESDTEEGAERLIAKLKRIMQKLRLDRVRQGEFESMMNREFNNVMTHYREEYPGASEADYLLACYLFAGFDGTTICTLMNLPSKQAVHSRKSRLLRKIRSGDAPHKKLFLKMLT